MDQDAAQFDVLFVPSTHSPLQFIDNLWNPTIERKLLKASISFV
jgi:hypothetical protein